MLRYLESLFARDYSTLVKITKKTILDEVKSQLIPVWLTHKASERQRQVDEKLTQKNEEYKKQHEAAVAQYERETYPQYKRDCEDYKRKLQEYEQAKKAHDESEEKNEKEYFAAHTWGFYYRRPFRNGAPFEPIEPSRPVQGKVEEREKEGFISQIKNEFIAAFQKLWDSRIQAIFDRQLDQFNPLQMVEELIKRHPWLYSEELRNKEPPRDHLVRRFLDHHLSAQLLAKLKPAAIESWAQLPGTRLESGLIEWQPMDLPSWQNWLSDEIAGYPLSQVRSFYVNHPRYEYWTLSFCSSVNNAAPRRIDLLRLLAKRYPLQMTSVRMDGVDCTHMAAMGLHDLEHLKSQQWKMLDIILVNAGEENNPLWFCAHRRHERWTLYIPESLRTGIDSLRKSFTNQRGRTEVVITDSQEQAQFDNNILNNSERLNEVVIVDYRENAQFNNIELDPLTQWHAVLLGRVLPACVKSELLATYRNRAPLSLLLQNVFEDALGSVRLHNINPQAAFTYRSPLSDQPLQNIFPQTVYVRENLLTVKELPAEHSLKNFDDHYFEITTSSPESKELNTLLVSSDFGQTKLSRDRLEEALLIIYHNPLTRLAYPPIEPIEKLALGSDNLDRVVRELFAYDTHLLTIAPRIENVSSAKLADYGYPLQCAARNRFLKAAGNSLAQAEKRPELRKTLWRTAGAEILRFFRDQEKLLDQDFVKSVLTFKAKWQLQYCEHEMEAEAGNNLGWTFLQIAQMGTEGLDALFSYLDVNYVWQWGRLHSKGAPQLPALFDLTGSLTAKPEDYILYLANKIKKFDSERTGCYPLFSSLALILPPLKAACLDNLLELIRALDQRRKDKPEENGELTLHNLNLNNPESEGLLTALENLAEKNNLQILIRLPIWDREAPQEQTLASRKARYRSLQNKVLDNQRKSRQKQLVDNLRNLADCETRLPAQMNLTQVLSQENQLWDGDDVVYPLGAKTQIPGIQMQMQEQLQQDVEVQQEQQQQQQQQQEQQQQVDIYFKDEGSLITRENIDSHCKGQWAAIPEEIKRLSGWQRSTLSQLFSLWVGSEQNAEQVIEKIEPEAVQELMEHASSHRLNLSKDNLPPGFFLAYSRSSRGLILCFDADRKQYDLQARAAKPLEKRDPYTVLTPTPRLASEFKGDYRQFAPLSRDPSQQQTLWRLMAMEDKDSKRLENALASFGAVAGPEAKANAEVAAVAMQRFDATGKAELPADYAAGLDILKAWAQQEKLEEGLRNSLFEAKSEQVLSPANFKAFGQLFNHYQAQDEKQVSAAGNWLQLANKIYRQFGPEAFAIWKRRLLDGSQNWTECLDQEEVDAVALSIATLKKQPLYQALWWKLVDAHGRALGPMRYSQLWHAFARFLDYVDKQHLRLNRETWKAALEMPDFNGQVFLDRLQRVLRRMEKQLDGYLNQQGILDQLSKIDWRHNGFYYAQRYEGFPYWHAGLKLSGFQATGASQVNTHHVTWPANSVLHDAKTQALRFGVERMQLRIGELKTFEDLLARFPEGKDGQVLRLFTACLSLGVDKVEQLSPETEAVYAKLIATTEPATTKLITWLNQALELDGPLTPKTLHLQFADLPLLATAMKEAQLPGQRQPAWSLSMINACGRALQYFKGKDRQLKLKTLLEATYSAEREFHHPAFMNYPWVLDECKHPAEFVSHDPYYEALTLAPTFRVPQQLSILQQQLKTIDFAKSHFYPKKAELRAAFKQIACAGNEAEAQRLRRLLVSEWVKSGCAIAYQDTPFRLLNEVEQKAALEHLDGQIRPNFHETNMLLFKAMINRNLLAVDTESGDPKTQLKELFNLLVSLDNKPHYNELGQVLGMLIEHARQGDGPERRYSVPQLTSWLRTLLPKTAVYAKVHYPTNLLKEILSNQLRLGSEAANLLNVDLQGLKAKTPFHLLSQIGAVSQVELPNQHKPSLVKLALQHSDQLAYVESSRKLLQDLHAAGVDSQWLQRLSKVMLVLAEHRDREFLLRELSLQWRELGKRSQTSKIEKLWQKTQLKLMDLLISGHTPPIEATHTDEDAYLRIILTQALGSDELDAGKLRLLSQVKAKLAAWSSGELRALAEYYSEDAGLSLAVLDRIATPERNTAEALIHHFEAVEQGLDEKGQEKRHYSITPQDQKDLQRVLQGMKRKGKESATPEAEQAQLLNLLYYLNNYSQVAELRQLTSAELQATLMEARNELMLYSRTHNTAKLGYACAHLLACMREVLLRKTGKWANHTQMLDLIYAGLNNDESLLHQVRAGQGKSIISAMRTSYLALTGWIVDLFSAKDALSIRDHEHFAATLTAMGIPHDYLTANSNVADYHHQPLENGIGAINFSTIGNWSLFQSRHIWSKNPEIVNLDKNKVKRAAFLDECDFPLKFEKTQFNYSDNQDGYKIYNLDEWVYRVAAEYYREMRQESEVKGEKQMKITRKVHLKTLCERLQAKVALSPRQSTFVEKYLIPALDKNNKAAIKERDRTLKQLLTAAHVAQELKEGVNYSLRPDKKTVNGGLVISTRIAKVTIDSQIRDGSTYSDWVHQFLHVRLNHEAAERGETPNFFVEPTSEIVLSQNDEYILPTFYSKREGCSATAGNADDFWLYQSKYGISQIIKLPSHEENKSEYMPTIYADTEKDQVKAIADEILKHTGEMNILETCPDDLEVKRLSKLVRAELESRSPSTDFSQFYVDTNDSGKKEKEMLVPAGRIGANTFSARMGRGTDIKPESKEKGMCVLRTYPAVATVVKQENGRQGRNGNPGRCRDIIHYGAVLKDYQAYSEEKSPYREPLLRIQEREEKHLEQKLQKHRAKKSNKWVHLDDPVTRKKYLITRAVTRLKYEIKQREDQYRDRKDLLINTLSGHVMIQMQAKINRPLMAEAITRLQKAWLTCRKDIEAAWSVRLADQEGDSDAVFELFFKKANAAWQVLSAAHPAFSLNAGVLAGQEKAKEQQPSLALSVPAQPQALSLNPDAVLDEKYACSSTPVLSLPTAIRFYQSWVAGTDQAYFTQASQAPRHLLNEIHGEHLEELQAFYRAIKNLATEKYAGFFNGLSEMMRAPKSSIYRVTCSTLATLLKEFTKDARLPHVESDLLCLKAFFNHSIFDQAFDQCTPGDIQKYSQLLNLVTRIFTKKFIGGGVTLRFIDQFCKVIHDRFWDRFDGNLASELEEVFAADANTTALLMRHTNYYDLYLYVDLIEKNGLANEVARKHQLLQYLKGPAEAQSQQEEKYPLEEKRSETADEAKLRARADALATTPFLLRPVFELALGGSSVHCPASHLPEPEVLASWDLATRREFWHFLTQRMPIEEKSYQEFSQQFLQRKLPADGSDPDLFRGGLIKRIFALPPFISLDYITRQLQFSPGQSYLIDAKPKLDALQSAGEAFHGYLKAVGLVNGNQAASADVQYWLQQWRNHFDALTVEKNERFFKLAQQFVAVPMPILLSLAKVVREEGRIFFDHLQENFQLAQDATKLSSEKRAFVEAKLSTILNDEQLTSMQKQYALEELEQFSRLVASIPTGLSPSALERFFTSWQADHDATQVKDGLLLIAKLREFDRRYPGFDLERAYLAEALSAVRTQFYLNFVEELNQPENTVLDAKAVEPIHRAYFDEKCLPNRAQLTTLCGVIREARSLREQKNYVDYFGDFESRRKQRQTLMQHMQHDLIKLGDDFSQRCYDEYRNLGLKLTRPQEVERKKSGERAQTWRGCYQAVTRFTEELVSLTRYPYQQAAAPGTAFRMLDLREEKAQQADNNLKTRYHDYFLRQRDHYASFWWVNRDRRKQAEALFGGVINQAPHLADTRADFYLANLRKIWEAQQGIMATDRGTQRNGKGYSRLLDMTVQMFVTVASDFLSDQQVNDQERLPLQRMLQQQLEETLDYLATGLGERHSLAKQLRSLQERNRCHASQWQTGSTEFVDLAQTLKRTQRKDVPKHLHYLLDHLDCFVGMTDRLPESRSAARLTR